MEAAPRLPMISFELKTSTEAVSFGPKLKQYIAGFYHEDPESYNNEIHNLESLRSAAVRPAIDVTGCQTLKKYYCQLNFLKSRFPMEKGQTCALSYSWKDLYASLVCSVSDIDFELSSILYNVGSLHTQLGSADSRSSSEGMKMSCTHFQCAAWAFQHLKENYSQLVSLSLSPEVIHFMYQLCLAQAQECILEKSMMDNRKSTIIAKVAVQVVDYYNQAISILMTGTEDGSMGEIVGSRVFKDWSRYLKFKVAYHSSVSLLYQGQQSEEAQKMGERVAYYQAASEQLEEARKISKGNMGQQQHEIDEALAFTQDVVEGKKKAAKNENEFIYHEVVPERDALQQVNGASLVKGIPFSVNDPDVSGSDLFQRLVPMEAHEASSVYSEQKAEMLRQIGAIVDTKDSELVEFMSSLQLDCLTQYRQALGVPQDVVDRAAAICAKPQATKALVEVMGRLSGTCHEVESLLGEIQELLKEEEAKEHEYQKIMGNRPPGIVSTDLTREAGKYSEAHSKANESNQTLHRAMTMHMANLKVLAQPISELKKAIPCIIHGDPSVDEAVVNELEALVAKVDEMRLQRATLVSQLREAVFADDITALLVTKPPEMSMEQLFQKELTKHKHQAALIEQNLAAQDNILSALTDIYARFTPTRRHILDILKRREATTTALIASYDAYDDLLAKANKGIEFYQKLEGNVTKLQQRVKSACRVNEEEREQMLAKSGATITPAPTKKTKNTTPAGPKLKDYLASMRTSSNTATDVPATPWLPSVRPTPLGSEETSDKRSQYDSHYPVHVPPQSVPAYPYQPGVVPDYYANTVQSTTGVTTLPTNLSQQYTYPSEQQQMYYPPYSTTNPVVPAAVESAPLPNPISQPHQQNYQIPSTYYSSPDQNISQTQIGYQMPAAYSSAVDPKSSQVLPQNYQSPANYYTIADAQSTQPQQIYNQTPTTYYTDTQNYPVAPITDPKSTGHYQQNYQIPSMVYSSVSDPKVTQYQQSPFQNYQMPAVYYSNMDSYTPCSTPQQNYPTPSAYSPCLDTKAPSQKQELPQPEYQTPAGYLSSSENYPSASGFPTAGYQQQIPEQQNVSTAPPAVVFSTEYNYPVNYQAGNDATATYNSNQYSQQHQAPTEEYQKQYQYIPQYYPTNNYQQVPQQTNASSNIPANTSQYTNAGANATYHTNPENNLPTPDGNPNSNNHYFSMPYGYQTPGMNSMTMMHANTNLTSSSRSTSSVSSSSNVDLLAGLDFSVGQAPLQPQVPVMSITEQMSNTSITETPKKTKVKITEKTQPQVNKKETVQEEKTVEETPAEVAVVEDPFADPEVLNSFSQEVEKLEKFVDGLTVKTLNGPTPLDIKWKEIQEQQDRDSQNCSISVARCYPMKNRFPDIMPYDQFRVELPSTKDDYINASHVKNVSAHSPPFIVTQAPLKSTFDDFWNMVWEQQIEVIVCLQGDAEMQQEASVYWPTERGMDLSIGRFRLVLQGANSRDNWIERIISIGDGTKHLVVVHLQFTGWPGGGLFPTTVFPLISLGGAVLACHRQQRVRNRPVLVHCLSGVGRSGVLCVLIAAMCDPMQMLDVSAAASRISISRKNILRDREHLKFAYQAVLQHARDLLSGRYLQAKIQNVNIGPDDSSSRRSSASSEQSVDQTKQRKKFTPESFGALKEQGISPAPDMSDPLSALDPLWTIRK